MLKLSPRLATKKIKMFTEKKFNIPKLKGLSEKTIEEHLKLYAGYVLNANLILKKTAEMRKAGGETTYAISEMERRFSFEYNGMRNHEIYFSLLENGPKPIEETTTLREKIAKDFGSVEKWLEEFKSLSGKRGIGWAILYYDKKENVLLNSWVDEQHFGQLQDCVPIIALDMWEHSFVADYQPSGKKQYIEDFFENLNFKTAEDFLTENS